MLKGFDHVNLRTARLEEMVAWYASVLGLRAGWRPDFSFPGAWLYLGDHALVHLVGEDRERRAEDLKLEHFAFRADGLEAFLERLEAEGVEAKVVEVPGADVVQVNVYDPDGNHIHVDFDAAERA